ncbi:hypothetical protein ACFQV2_02260 [Actinokineospora soli]|uniref:Uncharacterized protein n=1 Tax=Actinokineospora soli TaxID=1048753 RepID=A0ABW2TF50_9PSEU
MKYFYVPADDSPGMMGRLNTPGGWPDECELAVCEDGDTASPSATTPTT